ncbi:MAG: TIGR03936 family radical SAM-associated protein, partial [Gemmataceae bacterium]|nr:TIGR03936 family radical SAM-associated protein [Gemmataceae bacterium]
MTGDKLRFRFAKTGTLRLLSHHDLMRCLERMLRRAAVPFKSTAGFHPGPRVVFAQSLPLGVDGRDEVVEIELTTPCDADDILSRLTAQAPAGLAFTRVSVVPMKATATPRRVVYELPLPADRVEPARAAVDRLLAADKVWVDRERPSRKRLNIRPYVRGLLANGPASAGREAL